MRQILKALALAALLLPGIAAAQTPQYPQTLPPNTVWGRLGVNAGPPQAIPFATLSAKLTGASITLNSGNGQTAPGSMSGGNTYTFGANSDTPRFAGIGLGGVAPATGIEVYNAAVTPTSNGQGMFGATSVNGGMLIGQGSVYDATLANKSSAVALGVATGSTGIVLAGTLTAASLSTVGTVAGSICATSAGLILYEAGVNCFTVSGISVAGGKTLTVNNTLTLTGTDGTSFAFPATSDTVETLAATQTVSGNKTFSGTLNITGTGQINGTAFGTFATQNFATPPAIGGTTPSTGAFSNLTASTPIGLTSGGTNASTAASARASAGLNVDGYTPKGDTDYTMLPTDRTVGTSGSLTAPRTWTLPAASSVNAGQEMIVVDMAGGTSNTNTLTISRAGSDTVNGSSGVAITVTNGAYLLKSDGTSKWTAQQLGAQATVGVSSINGQTGNPSIVSGTGIAVTTSGGNISVAGTLSVNGRVAATTIQTPAAGRLTLTTAVAITTADVAGATSIFYTPASGDQVMINDGTNFVPTVFTELTLALDSVNTDTGYHQSGKGFDLFVVNDSGTIRLGTGPAWSSDTSRGTGAGTTELQQLLGIWTNKNTMTLRFGSVTANTVSIPANRATYVGSFYATANGQASDTAAKRLLWNAYNQAPRPLKVTGTFNSYTYSSATKRQVNADATMQVDVMCGLSGVEVSLRASHIVGSSGASDNPITGIGLDSTTVNSANSSYFLAVANQPGSPYASYDGYPGLGRHFLTWMEWAQTAPSGVLTWFGTNSGAAQFGGGLTGKVWS